jgi:hypothetical protein
MQDEPTPKELLEAVIGFLREIAAPALPTREAFDARVAANALELVAREISVGWQAQVDERRRLAALLGNDGELKALNEELSRRLAEGSLDGASAEVSHHLWATTMEKLAVDQPNYSAYRATLAERSCA